MNIGTTPRKSFVYVLKILIDINISLQKTDYIMVYMSLVIAGNFGPGGSFYFEVMFNV